MEHNSILLRLVYSTRFLSQFEYIRRNFRPKGRHFHPRTCTEGVRLWKNWQPPPLAMGLIKASLSAPMPELFPRSFPSVPQVNSLEGHLPLLLEPPEEPEAFPVQPLL